MPIVCKYIALYVPDVRAAEAFYRRAFGMDVVTRESERDGEWWTLPAGKSWDDAVAAGIDLGMVALRRDKLVLALFLGAPTSGTVYEICLGLPLEEISRLLEHPPDGLDLVGQDGGSLRFIDPFGFRWAVQDPDAVFRGSGDIAGRWLEV